MTERERYDLAQRLQELREDNNEEFRVIRETIDRNAADSAAAHHALGKKVDALTASMTGVEMADAREAGRTDLSRTIWKATAALITVMGVLVGAAFIIVDHV